MGKITTNAFWISSGNIGGRFLNFLATIYLARVLGASSFGLVSIGLSVLGYAVWLSNMGLSTIGTRETAKPKNKREFNPSALFWSRFIAGFGILLISLILVYLLPLDPGRQHVIALFLLSVIPQALLLDWYFNGLQRYKEVAGSTFLKSLVFLILTYVIISSSNDVLWVPLLYLAGNLTAMAFFFTCLNQPFKLIRFTLTPITAKKVIKKSLTVGLGSSFNEVIQLLPTIVIGAFISTTEAGIYSAAMKVILIGTLLDRVFVHLFLPMFTAYWSENPKHAKQVMNRIFRIMLTLGVFIGISFMIASEWIMIMLFGSEYSGSISLIRVLSWFLTATFVNSVFAFGLLAINQDQAYLRSMFRGGLISALLITGLTALGDAYWTALAVVLSEFCIMSFNYYEISFHINTKILQPAIAAVVTISLSVILFYILPLTFYFQLPVILLITLLAYYLMGGIINSDISWIYQLAKR